MFLTKKIALPKVVRAWCNSPFVWPGLTIEEFHHLEKIFEKGVGKMTFNLNIGLLILCVCESYDLSEDYGPFESSHVRKRMPAAIALAMPEWATVKNIANLIKENEHFVRVCIDKYSAEHEVNISVTRYRVIRALLDSDLDGIWDKPEEFVAGIYNEFDGNFDSAKFVSL